MGVVTADSDGQHTVECIENVTKALIDRPEELILGVRDFDEEGIPWKSEFGNKLTMKVLQYVSGLKHVYYLLDNDEILYENVLYRSEEGSPILLWCNNSGIEPNMEINIVSNEGKVFKWFYSSFQIF